jgi:hypothetical protein
MTHKNAQPIMSIEEWDAAQPLLGADTRPCAKCRQPTYWRTARQPRLGHCLDCTPFPPTTAAVLEELDERALDLVLDAFPGTSVGGTTRAERDHHERRWLLLRLYWVAARRWDQRWVWLSLAEAAPLMTDRWEHRHGEERT